VERRGDLGLARTEGGTRLKIQEEEEEEGARETANLRRARIL